ncbi:MAG: sulfite reductase, ferredoxin dependent [Geitlerinemataceae cyanobacterium]|mgnify:CR=1 FL=1
MTTTTKTRSKLEDIKEASNFLREPVATEILQDTTHFSQDAVQILKFHGSYQQDNRENRVLGQEKDYRMMIRTSNPGGFIPPQLYKALDKLSSDYGNDTLRVTTRQGFQLHGILKKNLKATVATIVRNLGSTLGACGDLNRNVMAPPAPFKDRPEYQLAWEYADNIAHLLRPQSGAYYEIWLDGEKAISGEKPPQAVTDALRRNGNGTIVHEGEEPLYGDRYMPRKFKSSVTVVGDNSVDLFSQDLSLVVITDEAGNLLGFNIYAGGGLARTHRKEETFPRLADAICYVDKDDVYDMVKAIVAVQRDYGDRVNRRHARLKYLLFDWGVEKFRTELAGYFGKPLVMPRELPPFQYEDFLGWHDQGDSKLFLGLAVQNGRVQDKGSWKLRSALREIVDRFDLPMRLTPHQNILFYDIEPGDRAEIESILERCKVKPVEAIDTLERLSMACPAMPLCGLAITEAERALPGILSRLRKQLKRIGLGHESFVTRMTGCPNGCARPYMAELGFVGQGPDAYQIWVGADPHQTRLAQPLFERVKDEDIETTLEPIFVSFKRDRHLGESFGDYCNRAGLAALREFAASYTPPKRHERRRVRIEDEVYVRLKAASDRSGTPMLDMATEALAQYLERLES